MAENILTMSPDYSGDASEVSNSRIGSDSEAAFIMTSVSSNHCTGY